MDSHHWEQGMDLCCNHSPSVFLNLYLSDYLLMFVYLATSYSCTFKSFSFCSPSLDSNHPTRVFCGCATFDTILGLNSATSQFNHCTDGHCSYLHFAVSLSLYIVAYLNMALYSLLHLIIFPTDYLRPRLSSKVPRTPLPAT